MKVDVELGGLSVVDDNGSCWWSFGAHVLEGFRVSGLFVLLRLQILD